MPSQHTIELSPGEREPPQPMGLRHTLITAVRRLAPRKLLGDLTLASATAFDIDLLRLAYRQHGIDPGTKTVDAAEDRFIEQELPRLLPPNPVIFDVGANVGEYSARLRRAAPSATIYAVEPNPLTFAALQERAKQHDVRAFCVGVGSAPGTATLYTPSDEPTSGRSTVLPGVLTAADPKCVANTAAIQLTTLDALCSENNIDRIDFLKMDIEGFELDALKGASRLLSEGRIGVIQFEFNVMNIDSKVFLRDFYDILHGWSFYRLRRGGMMRLGNYTTRNEIFAYQNIVAVRRP